MRDRRNGGRRGLARTALVAGSLALRLGAMLARRPVDGFAILGAGAATLVIVVNAVFLQSGPHPAPFFANPTPQPAPQPVSLEARPRTTAATTQTRPAVATPMPQPVAIRRNDPIAELIGRSSRIMAVQRALSEFGYGQIKPSGRLDAATIAAIEKFERERKLPVTGQISDRLVSELSSVTGRSLQ